MTLDALVVRCRDSSRTATVCVVHAVGVNRDGFRESLGVDVVTAEGGRSRWPLSAAWSCAASPSPLAQHRRLRRAHRHRLNPGGKEFAWATSIGRCAQCKGSFDFRRMTRDSNQYVVVEGNRRLLRRNERTREVLAAAYRVIIREGLEATTLRKIAEEGGFTTGVLAHHFRDKRALITATFKIASADWMVNVKKKLSEQESPSEQMAALVRYALPHSPERQREWRLWCEMYTYAGRDREFAETVIATEAEWELVIRSVLDQAQCSGLLRAELDTTTEAAVLVRLIDGVSLRAWMSGDWDLARRQLLYHVQTLGFPKATSSPHR